MTEIGGYIELDDFHGSMLHEKAKHLNCGRNALAYLIESRKIKKYGCHIFCVIQLEKCVQNMVL